MDHLQKRTSITIDEAIAILMGYATGPIDLEPDPISDCDEAWDNIPAFDLGILAEERASLEGEYDLAKYEKRPAPEIEEKQAALKRQLELIDQSYDHRCAINDELNKGERSMLRVDIALSNPAFTYITLHSFKEWVKCRDTPAVQPGAAEPVGSPLAGAKDATKPKPRTKLREQEDAILAEIRKQGVDSMALPRNPSGKSGVKAAVRESLKKSPLFEGKTAFDKAWERLGKDRRIAHEA